MTTNDLTANDNGNAESPFTIPVGLSFVEPPAVTIIDDGDATGYTQTNGWNNANRATSYGGDFAYKFKGAGNESVTWDFTNLASGTYRAHTTWDVHVLRATQAPYTVTVDGESQGTTILVDQTQAPSETIDGVKWGPLGTFVVFGNQLKVELTDIHDQYYVIADAVRIERIGDVG
jgi:hypothetical protein